MGVVGVKEMEVSKGNIYVRIYDYVIFLLKD